MVTDARISCNRSDIVVFLKQEKRILFLEVSCPADVNVEEEKVQKYHAGSYPIAMNNQLIPSLLCLVIQLLFLLTTSTT